MKPGETWLVPAAEIVTVGLPFCVFKLLTGSIALQSAPLVPLGWALLVLGCVDALINTLNLLALPIVHRRLSGACVLELLLRRLGVAKGGDLGLALDVFFSFALVAVVVGLGLLRHLPAWALSVWNAAVVLNVLGAGVGRLLTALRSEQPA